MEGGDWTISSLSCRVRRARLSAGTFRAPAGLGTRGLEPLAWGCFETLIEVARCGAIFVGAALATGFLKVTLRAATFGVTVLFVAFRAAALAAAFFLTAFATAGFLGTFLAAFFVGRLRVTLLRTLAPVFFLARVAALFAAFGVTALDFLPVRFALAVRFVPRAALRLGIALVLF